jgi:regulatory protein YycI of two-component signal transduction system YycFG
MFFYLNSNNTNRINYCNGKHIFITFVFLNIFLGCIYYINKQEIISNKRLSRSSNETYNAIEFIQNTLANEYNQDDLIQFYAHVKNEYSLGLKCTRKPRITFNLTIADR